MNIARRIQCRKISTASIIAVLKQSIFSKDLEAGKNIHSKVLVCCSEFNIFVESTLVDMYAKCGSINHARLVFDCMPWRNIVAWNCLIHGYVNNGQNELALEIFKSIENEVQPNARTYTSVVAACTSLGSTDQDGELNAGEWLQIGKNLHSKASTHHCIDVFLNIALITMYGRLRSLAEAQHVFEGMEEHDVVAWNALLQAYVENGESKKALDVFSAMERCCVPDARTYVAVLAACISIPDAGRLWLLGQGRAIHLKAVSNRCFDTYVGNMLITLYAKANSMGDAKSVFDGIVQRDVVSWNALLQGYVENEEPEMTIQLFDHIEDKHCVPDSRTYVAALSACAALANEDRMKWLEKGRSIHYQAVRNKCCDTFVENTLINMYSRCGSLSDAHSIFERTNHRNVVTWNALLYGYVEDGKSRMALKLFDAMDISGCKANARTYVAALAACASLAKENKRWLTKGDDIHTQALTSGCCNIFVENALLDMYMKGRSTMEARKIFDGMLYRDIVTWNCLIQGYVENGEDELALEMLQRMVYEGVTLKSASFVAGVMACKNLEDMKKGMHFHSEILRRGLESDTQIGTCLVEFYGKCGERDVAIEIFDSIVVKDVYAWNALLSGYNQQGETTKVIQLFETMEQERSVYPNEVSFTHVLTACGQASLTKQAKGYFEEMQLKYSIPPDKIHYTCMIDLLARDNCIEEALRMVEEMPFDADVVMWTSILGACHKWNNVAAARVAYNSLLKLDENAAVAYVLMGNIHIAAPTNE